MFLGIIKHYENCNVVGQTNLEISFLKEKQRQIFASRGGGNPKWDGPTRLPRL